MDFCFRKYSYPFVVVLLVFLFSCHSLPPSEPLPPEEKGFDPRELSWQQVSMPGDLLGDWYIEGKLDLTVGEDTLRVRGTWSLIQSTEKSDLYYRIIYKIGSQYRAMYLRNITETGVQIAYTDSMAVSEEGASARPVAGAWITLTSTNPWIAASMPGEMPGNWHIHDGKMEMEIDRERVVLDGESWEIDSVETNRTVERLILRNGERYKSLYFREVGSYTMGAFLTDGKEDIQDRYGKVHGDWQTLYRWWDFIEKCRLYPGSRWVYDYSYSEYYTKVYNTTTPIDSIVQTNSLKGQFEIEVTSSTIQEGTGGLILQAAFLIDEEKGRYYHARKDGKTEVLTDSSWVNPGILKTEQYEIVLENDTLWYETEAGKVFFASAKIESGAAINLRAFVYPFEFPREGFPEGRDIIVNIQFSPVSRPQSSTALTSGWNIKKRAQFVFSKGLQDIYYLHYAYERRYWRGSEQYLNPYEKDTSFDCKLFSFTPGQ